MTRNLFKLLPGIILKAGIKESSAKVQFSYKHDALGPPKRHFKLQQNSWKLQGALLGVLGSPKGVQGTARVSKMPPKAVPGRHPDIQKVRKSDIQISRHPDIQTSRQPRHPDIQTSRHPDIQTSRQPDIQTSRHPDMQTPVHPDIQTTRHPGIQASRHHSPITSHRQGAGGRGRSP